MTIIVITAEERAAELMAKLRTTPRHSQEHADLLGEMVDLLADCGISRPDSPRLQRLAELAGYDDAAPESAPVKRTVN